MYPINYIKRGCYEIDSSKGSVLTAFLLSIFSDFFLLGFTFGNSSPGVSSGSSYFTSAFVLPLMKLNSFLTLNPQLNSIISSSAFRIPVLLKRTFDMSSFMIPNTPSDCMDLSILMRIPSGDRRSFLASSFSLSYEGFTFSRKINKVFFTIRKSREHLIKKAFCFFKRNNSSRHIFIETIRTNKIALVRNIYSE